MKLPGALLIDFGGTLALERASRASIYAAAAAQFGARVPEARMAALMGEAHGALPTRAPMRYTRPWFERFIERIFVAGLGFSAGELDGVTRELFGRFGDPETFRVYPDARALLAAARGRGVPVAVVSNWTDTLEELIAGLDLGPFAAIASSASLRAEKPDAEIFEWALDQVGVPPRDALHVGDSWTNDVLGARALGIEAVLLDRGPQGGQPGPPESVRVVHSLDELVPRFGGRG